MKDLSLLNFSYLLVKWSMCFTCMSTKRWNIAVNYIIPIAIHQRKASLVSVVFGWFVKQFPNRTHFELHIYSLCYSPPNTISHCKQPQAILYAIAFSARINGLQVDKVNRENDSRSTRHIHLVASKLIPACNGHTLSSPGVA